MKVSRLADVAVILASLALLGHLALQYWQRTPAPDAAARNRAAAAWREASHAGANAANAANTAAQEYRIGEALPAFPDVDYAAADRTLLLFVRSTCRFCTASMPFYARIEQAVRRGHERVRLIAVSSDTRDELDGYLHQHALQVDQTVPVDVETAGRLKIRGTPTLVLADKQGVVLETWVGLLPGAREPEVIAKVAGETAAP
jgi:hypothetical protein